LKKLKIRILIVLILVISPTVFADITENKIKSFILAQEAMYQPKMTSDDIERYLSYMTEDFTDHHAAYNVTMKGKESDRKNMPEMVKSIVNYKFEIEDIIIGRGTAIVSYFEIFKENKGKNLVSKNLRTIMVLEFNEDGLINHIRRYQD